MISVILALFCALVHANPIGNQFVVLEHLNNAPKGFVKDGPGQDNQVLDLRIALVSKDMAGLEEALYQVSTPDSEKYGQHLSKEEVETFVAPHPQTVAAVDQWLSSNNITSTSISPAGDWIGISVPVSKANGLFKAEFSTFIDETTGSKAIRTLSYSIPVSLQGHIEFVYPTVTFPVSFSYPRFMTPVPIQLESNITSDDVLASCATTITPTCLQALYGIPFTKATHSTNGLAVSGFIDQFAQNADLQSFLQAQRPDLVGSSFSVQSVDGGTNPQGPGNAGIEANLDIQYTVGVASGVPVTFISVGDNTNDGLFGFLDIINFLLQENNLPHVLTTSYGLNEDDVSKSLAIKLCNAYMQLGARGTSILFASGDGGVSGGHNGECSTFQPTFPSGCPFMTSVGATTGIIPEIAASFSSGGFSNYFATPGYQKSAVSGYLSILGKTNAGLFNSSGRGFPDVSAQGVSVEIVSDGQTGTVDGTSCSSPIFASIVALLNDRRVAAGKRPLGFLNPFLYSKGAAAIHDITSGSNPGCNTNGFPATKGWDPVTGLGTPKFAALLRAAGV